jgi:alkylation response protein AidB-like acyl-CoA dehydrogenase
MLANGTETVAVEQSDGTYKLYGYKWFSSATDADITFTLARAVDKQGNTIQVCNRKCIET